MELGELREDISCQGVLQGVWLDEHECLFKFFVVHGSSFSRYRKEMLANT
jgi:hypothetical protein